MAESCRLMFFEWLARQESPRILEFGVASWDGRAAIHHREEILRTCPSAEWVGTDDKTDHDVSVVADAHELSKLDIGLFDGIICASTLEHLRRPWVAAKEMAAVTKPYGKVFIQTHQCFPLHGYPHDYFRFTTQGLREIFARDAGWIVLHAEYTFPCTVVPTTNAIPANGWNFQAEAWLNSEMIAERI